ncbi:MAG: hypothetical protein WCX64_05445 [Candidatus Micrarchaeia archaeon]
METSRSDRRRTKAASRGQMWIIDAMVSGTFITLILFMMLGTQGQLSDKYVQADSEITFSNTLLMASDSLVLTPGRPANWDLLSENSTRLESVGIASSPNVISSAKALRLQQLNATNYTEIKTAMGLGAVNTSIEVTLLGDSVPLYSFGKKSGGSARSTVFERVAVLDDGRPVILRIEVG